MRSLKLKPILFLCLICFVQISCFRDITEHLDNMDRNTDRMARELEATNHRIDALDKTMDKNMGRIADEAERISMTMRAFEQLATDAKEAVKMMMADYSQKVPPAPMPGLNDILGPETAPTPSHPYETEE